jgi:hypothetical protein
VYDEVPYLDELLHKSIPPGELAPHELELDPELMIVLPARASKLSRTTPRVTYHLSHLVWLSSYECCVIAIVAAPPAPRPGAGPPDRPPRGERGMPPLES